MKIFALNSSPRKQLSNTDRILRPFLESAQEAGAEVDLIYLQDKQIRPCLGCFDCWFQTPGKCIQKDDMPELLNQMVKSDVVVFATPLYVFGVSAQMKLFLDRIIPMALPIIELRDGHCTHPAREGAKMSGMVLISNCGFHELDNFDALVAQFKQISCHSGMKFLGALLRPEGEFMPFAEKLMPDKAKEVLDAIRKAGRQVVKENRISDDVLKAVSKNFMPIEAFIQGANAYFKSVLDEKKKKKKKK